MTQANRILCLAISLITLLLFPLRAAAQSATVTDEAFLSNNPATQEVYLDSQGTVLIVAGSSAMVGPTSVGTTKTYIKFQLQSSLPPLTAASNVAKATLKMYLSRGTNPSGAIDIYPITSAWSESTISASAPPSLASSAFVTAVAVSKANSFVVVDITQLVQDWLKGSANGGLDNDGIAVVADTGNSLAMFDGRRNTATSHEPRLEIVLVDSGPQGPQGPAGAAGTAGAAATVAVGTTTTVSATMPALVTNAGTSNAALLNFQIPQGPAGPAGPASALTGVIAGTDLTGGGATGNVTLNLNVAATDARYAQLGTPNTFGASQNVTGNLFASGPITSGNSLRVIAPAPGGGIAGTGGFAAVFNVDPLGNFTSSGNAIVGGNLNTGGTLSLDSPTVAGGRFAILSNGNVGIGNPNPATTLDVAGPVRANALVSTGPVQIGGDTPMTSAPHMFFSGSFPGSFCGGGNCGASGIPVFPGGFVVPDRNILITHISFSFTDPIDASCSPPDVGISINATPGIRSSFAVSFSLPTGIPYALPILVDFPVSPPLSVPAGSGAWVGITYDDCNLGASGGGNGFANVQYVMQ
jgi:hypothetical protein